MINFYRLDTMSYLGVYGGKAEIAYHILQNDYDGIVTCGSRQSVQILTFAQMCDKLHKKCIIHTPSGKETKIINELKKTDAQIIYEKVGYNNVLNAHAKLNAEKLNYKFIPLGMVGCQEAFDIVANNTSQLLYMYPETKRIVVPVGSGTTLIGVCQYLYKNKINIPVLGVSVGMNVDKICQKYIQYNHYKIIKSIYSYDKFIQHDFLNPIYEAKCVEYLQDGDTMYVVSR